MIKIYKSGSCEHHKQVKDLQKLVDQEKEEANAKSYRRLRMFYEEFGVCPGYDKTERKWS